MKQKAKIYLLHGWATHGKQAEKWGKFIHELKELGVNPSLLALPGLSAPLNEEWQLSDYVHWLASILPTQPVILLGHSFGGQLASRFAATHPNRVKKLVLIDSSGLRNWSLRAKLKRTVFGFLAKTGKKLTKSSFLRNALYKLAREKDYQQASPLLRKTLANILEDETWNDLPKITKPTLIIWGRKDRVTPLKMGRVFSKKIKNSTLHIIRNARHAPHFSHPKQVAQVVTEFVTEET